jgi:branched-chain amino acid transport system permease protein
MSRGTAAAAVQLLGPALLIVAVALLGSVVPAGRELDFQNALVMTAVVVALYTFVGNSGVISFGHISFVAVGAYLSAEVTIDKATKEVTLPDLFPVLGNADLGNVPSLLLGAAVGAAFAFVVGVALMRLSGLPAGIATFAVLGITYNVLRNWTKISPGPSTLSSVPETTTLTQAAVGALIAAAVAFAYQRSRAGRQLRATREDAGAAQAAGIDVYRQRLLAFTLSGGLAGFAGGLLVHLFGTITPEEVYLDLTFLTLAMLVIGGVSSLWGAVVGALLVSGLDSFLSDAEETVHVPFALTLPDGSRLVVLGAFMALILIFRPQGITGGRELSLPRRRPKQP